MNRLEAMMRITQTEGKIFSVIFEKKDGSIRQMVCRLNVKKGINGKGMKYNPTERNLLPVWDMNSDGFRMINLETVQKLTIAGNEWDVTDE